MYKIGVIGDRESVLGFKAVGLEVFDCESADEAEKTLKKAAEEDFAIIYVTETFYSSMTAEIDKYRESRLPAIIPVPDRNGSSGMGMENLKKSVERAVGADILFGGE